MKIISAYDWTALRAAAHVFYESMRMCDQLWSTDSCFQQEEFNATKLNWYHVTLICICSMNCTITFCSGTNIYANIRWLIIVILSNS